MHTYVYIYTYIHTIDLSLSLSIYIYIYCFYSASLPYKFLTRLPGVCSGGGGSPPETLNGLTRNPLSYTGGT